MWCGHLGLLVLRGEVVKTTVQALVGPLLSVVVASRMALDMSQSQVSSDAVYVRIFAGQTASWKVAPNGGTGLVWAIHDLPPCCPNHTSPPDQGQSLSFLKVPVSLFYGLDVVSKQT